MTDRFERMGEEHRSSVVSLFNHYVLEGFAAYAEEPVPPSFFDRLRSPTEGHVALVALDETGDVAGFGLLRPYHWAGTLRRTARVSYFLRPDQTRKGLGAQLLARLTEVARGLGIDNLVADVSSLNEASLAFHRKQGFTERGRLMTVGRKRGHDFDVVLFQKAI